MENSILNKLPREIRDNIYAMVFKDAKITIEVGDPRLDGSKIDFRCTFSRRCALAITCRAIRDESLVAMWHSAVCEAVMKSGSAPWLYHFRKALPDEFAKHITHLRNVRIPTTEDMRDWPLEACSMSFLEFPQLQSCGIQYKMYQGRWWGNFHPCLDLDNSYRKVDELKSYTHTGLERRAFHFTNWKNPSMASKVFLEKEFGIGAGCTVDMIAQLNMPKFPVNCSATASRRGIGVHLLPCVAWLNFSTGMCWVEDVDKSHTSEEMGNRWMFPDDEEGFRQILH